MYLKRSQIPSASHRELQESLLRVCNVLVDKELSNDDFTFVDGTVCHAQGSHAERPDADESI